MATRPEVPRGFAGPSKTVSEIVLPEPLSYRLKKWLLGPPLVTERLSEERLGKPTALGVLSPDCISSTAYGSEEILVVLVQAVGVAAFSLLLPITLAVIVVLFFVTMSYREVVMVYTKAGGSYVVARENFGVRIAQIAAVALIIDYIVTVAVQTAAGTDALTSAFPTLRIGNLAVNLTTPTASTAVTVGVVLLLFYGNLRGIREAGRTFALPTYLFIFSIGALILIGVVEWALGDLHQLPLHHLSGEVPFGKPGGGLLEGAGLVIVLRAFANGGSSLTGLEAISNGVATFKPPEGTNARRVLVIMATILGTLVLGVSLIAHATHPVPFISGSPSVLSQEATIVFHTSPIGRFAFYFLQGSTMLILYTGANTSFNGFPNLASFVAEDAYLPRRLTRRGHRLVFSNGIILLTIFSTLLLVVTRARVNALVAVYAIGVFTGFTMAGAGMVKHQLSHRVAGWRRRILINGFAAVLSGSIVLIFAIVKFKEGAWVVVLLFPLLVVLLIRLHKQYEEEKAELEVNAARACEAPTLRRHVVLVFVERLDLATARAIQVGRSFNPSEIRAVHFVLDTREAKELEWQWGLLGLAGLPLDLVECPDRRLVRAAMSLVADVAQDAQTEVSVLLPRRVFEGRWWRVLHDRTADDIAGHVGDIPHANATIVPFPVGNRKRAVATFPIGGPAGVGALRPQQPPKVPGRLRERRRDGESSRAGRRTAGRRSPGRRRGALTVADAGVPAVTDDNAGPGEAPAATATPGGPAAPGRSRVSRSHHHRDDAAERHVEADTVPISEVRWRQRARVWGRVYAVRVQPRAGLTSLECTLADGTGQLVLVFQGRRHVPGIEPGARLIVEGMVGQSGQRPAMINPNYQILAGPEGHEV
jgi:amino acid transporter